MSTTVGTVAELVRFPSGAFSVRLNGTPTGTQISGWNPSGTYVGSDAGMYDSIAKAWALTKAGVSTPVKVDGSATANGTYTSYENIDAVTVT